MARGALNKPNIDYFQMKVDIFEDDKIFDLLDEYGPLGLTIYLCILTIVYANGYYANLSKDKLSRMVIRKVGNKWTKSQKVVVQVIDYCADLGLLHKDLMLQNIITSEGIQRRYYKMAVKQMKRQLYSTEYWLLDENMQPLLNAPLSLINSEESPFNSEEINHSSEVGPPNTKETKLKETKEIKKEKVFVPEEDLNEAILRFMKHREGLKKPIADDTVSLLIEELEKIGKNTGEKIAILNKSVMSGWTGIFPLNNKSTKASDSSRGNQFQNFPQRGTDYDAMVIAQLQEK